jgi:hypothetical protein
MQNLLNKVPEISKKITVIVHAVVSLGLESDEQYNTQMKYETMQENLPRQTYLQLKLQ